MPRYFIDEILEPNRQTITLTGEDAHHIRTVLRMTIGDPVVVCDGAGTDIHTVIDSFEDGRVGLNILKREKNRTEPIWQAHLFQGLPKGDKMEQIIQKSIELGVGSITPVECRRSVAKISAAARERKLERWNKIAQEAAKQCGRGRTPLVCEPVTFNGALKQLATLDLAFVPWENERDRSLKQVLTEFEKNYQREDPSGSIGFLIGPEGGFSPDEIDALLAAGLNSVTLGARILRTETAAPAVLAMLGYQFDQK